MAVVAVGHNSPPAGVREKRYLPTWGSPDLPAPTIKAEPRDRGPNRASRGGAGNVVVNSAPERPAAGGKPAYRVPTMAEIRAIPWNGLTVASTFSGCGGSSLGYRLAGYRVVYASEFVEAARDTYRANAAPYTHLDPRDIRTVTAESFLKTIGMARGELDLLDGSPPCASFSTSGRRQAGWGQVKKYSDTTQRTDDLFYEFARILRGAQPKVFVAENVSGLIKGTAKGYFIRIMQELRACGYRVDAKLLDAQWLGVPQARQRLIFVGVRNDLRRAPAYPRPLPYRYAVREVLAGIGRVTAKGHGFFDGGDMDVDRPSPTVVASPGGAAWYGHEVHPSGGEPITHDPETGKDLRIAGYAIGREYARLAQGEVSRKYLNLIRGDERRPSFSITAKGGQVAAAGPVHATVARKFTLGELRRICSFPDDFVLTGTYEQRWERLGRAVPPVMMQHIATAVRTQILDTL